MLVFSVGCEAVPAEGVLLECSLEGTKEKPVVIVTITNYGPDEIIVDRDMVVGMGIGLTDKAGMWIKKKEMKEYADDALWRRDRFITLGRKQHVSRVVKVEEGVRQVASIHARYVGGQSGQSVDESVVKYVEPLEVNEATVHYWGWNQGGFPGVKVFNAQGECKVNWGSRHARVFLKPVVATEGLIGELMRNESAGEESQKR